MEKKILVEKYHRKVKLIQSWKISDSILLLNRTKIICKGFNLKYSLFSMSLSFSALLVYAGLLSINQEM